MKKNACIYAGTFDPPTHGHLNVIERGLKIFDSVVIAVAKDTSKKSLFGAEERVDILKKIFGREKRVEIESFEGLLVEYAKQKKIRTLLRGIRTVGDYEFEFQMSLANRSLAPNIETIFIMTEGRFSHISSTIIKQVIALGGSGKDMVHPLVEKKLRERLLK